MTLCNQGCKTHVYFRDGEPYNLSDDEPHKKTCMSLKIGKWWGGYYNTIPMGIIKERIEQAYLISSVANRSRNIDEILKALTLTVDNLQFVTYKMDEQEEKNATWKEEFAEYKTNLVQEQTLREERKKTNHNEQKKTSSPQFTTADKL